MARDLGLAVGVDPRRLFLNGLQNAEDEQGGSVMAWVWGKKSWTLEEWCAGWNTGAGRG